MFHPHPPAGGPSLSEYPNAPIVALRSPEIKGNGAKEEKPNSSEDELGLK
jgi:hypothetical protein